MPSPWARAVVLVALLAAASGIAHAQHQDGPSSDPPPAAGASESASPGASRRALAVGATWLPGLVAHGSGLYTLGDERGGRSLLAMQGFGLALLVAGGAPLALTGAARDITWPAVPMVVGGAGLFAVSWLADLYGVSGLAALAAGPAAPRPLELELGYAYVRDAVFDYSQFAVVSARVGLGNYGFDPSAWIAVDADNQRWRLPGRWRLWDYDGHRHSYLEALVALTWHRFGDDDFSSQLGELSVAGRLDLGRLSSNLRGSYVEMSTGAGLEWLRYDLRTGNEDDLSALLLGSFALGMQLGRVERLRADLQIAYDHRRDDFAAGLATSTRGSGFAGHIGAAAKLTRGRWGLRSEAWFGAAHVFHLGVAHSFGGSP